jgi:hypothetical protein
MNKNSSHLLQAQRKKKSSRSLVPFLQQVQPNARSPRIETKSFPFGALTTAVYSGLVGQYIADLTAVTQGVSGAQRVGDKLFPFQLLLRFNLWNNTGVTSNLVTNWRIWVFQYKADSSIAAHPSIADFLQTSVANAGTVHGSFSNYDIDYDRECHILWDSGIVQTVGNHGAVVTGVPSLGEWALIEKNITLGRNRRIDFFTGGTTGYNHIFLAVTTDQATIASNPLLTYSSQFRYTDS